MAGTDDDLTTPEWRLLRAALEFVAVQCSTSVAKELLLEWLDQGWIRYRCEKLEYNGFAERARRFFFRRQSHSHITVDWDNSGATRVGPPWVAQQDPEGDTWPFYFLHRPIISLRMRLIWLHHGDVVAMMRQKWLLPPSITTVLLPSPPPLTTTAGALVTSSAAIETSDTSVVSGAAQSPSPASGPKLPRDTCKSWLPEARKRIPQNPGEGDAAYARRLTEDPSCKWKEGTIVNELLLTKKLGSQKSHKK
jgi:hypothetical protein